uniref:Centrosomal protein 131 n=1 Tax=Amphiprion percula TaxID=161767 RepID=A0A3P8T2Z3_AMPPE
MHTTRSPSSIPTGVSGDALDLSLSGSQLSMSKRPSSASPGKYFSRSVSVSVAGDSRGKRNTLFGCDDCLVPVFSSQDQSEDYLTLFDSSSDGRKKLASLSKTSPDRTTWNILDDQPRAFPLHSSSRSTGSVDSPTGLKKREPGIALAATFTANNRSNKGAVGNSVTTILHNNYSEKPLTPKSSNQKPSFKYVLKLSQSFGTENGSLTKSQKNFSSASSTSINRPPVSAQRGSPVLSRRREVTEEEAERFIQQVNQAAVTIQRWYRRQAKRHHTNQATLKRILASKRKVSTSLQAALLLTFHSPSSSPVYISIVCVFLRRSGRREQRRMELQQKRAQRAAEVQHAAEVELEGLRQAGVVGRRKPPKISVTNKSLEILQRSVSVEDQRQGTLSSRAQSKTTLNELLDTLKLLEEEPERLSEPKCYRKEKYDGDSNSLTTDNLERHGQLSHHPALPDGGALLSEAKLQSIMSFLDEMEKSEQERPRSAVLSEEELVGVEQASATAAEVTGSMMRIKMELEEKKRTVNMLQTALAQQRELTVRHVKETEKELSRNFRLQKEQYEATIQRHLTFIDQLINDKKALSERCEGVVGELKQVDQKYTKKMTQMQEQHEMEIKKLKDLMSATEKIRREKWIDEKTKKIKEITVKGLEPEIQKLISKHKQELKKLRTLHEAELLQADDRAAQRYIRQCEELRQQLEKEKEEQCQRERELAKQRYEKQLQEEELSLQQQRRRLYKEVSDEKERLAQLATRQRVELEDLRRQLEENSSLAGRALREELDKTREEQERRHQVEMKALQERLDIEKQTWEENYKKKEEAWLLSRERELKEGLRRERDKEIELAIWTLEEETSKDKEECERAADSRVKRVREKYESELRELERSERTAVEKQQELRKQQMETEGEMIRLQALLRQKEQEIEDVTQDKLADERHSLAEVIRQEFADRLVVTEEENRRMKVEVSEVRARLRLEVERITREKEEELAEVHQRVKSAILKKEETVSNLRKQHEVSGLMEDLPHCRIAPTLFICIGSSMLISCVLFFFLSFSFYSYYVTFSTFVFLFSFY